MHRQKKYNVLTDLLKRIRDQGVLVGLSAHDPTLIEIAEQKSWDVDYYMTALYQQFGDQVAENAAIVREVGSRG